VLGAADTVGSNTVAFQPPLNDARAAMRPNTPTHICGIRPSALKDWRTMTIDGPTSLLNNPFSNDLEEDIRIGNMFSEKVKLTSE
jgi:hypothetical protein